MEVKQILPFRLKRMAGPFIFMNHAGPVQLNTMTTAELDVLPHPHIGLSTVSYLLTGEVTHRDSLVVEPVLQPGEVNRMTAGQPTTAGTIMNPASPFTCLTSDNEG